MNKVEYLLEAAMRLPIAIAFAATVCFHSGANAAGLDDAKRGLAELVRGNFARAVALNTRAIESGELERESLAISYFNRAEGYLKLQRETEAHADFRRAYEAWPEHPVTRQKLRDLGLLD